MLRLVALSASLAASACGNGVFFCQDDQDCMSGATVGMCAVGDACSFPADDCPSGQRYGEHAGDLSGECVPSDGSTTSTATADASSSPTSLDVTGVATNASEASEASDTVDTSGATTPLTSSTTDVEPTSTAPTTMTDTTTDESSTGGVPIDPDLLVWLRFEGKANDAVANHGVLGGVASCGDDCPNVDAGVAEYDGLGDCLSFPSDATLVGHPFTASGWLFPYDVVNAFVMGKRVGDTSENSWEIYLGALQQMAVEMYGPPDVVVETPAP